MADIAKPAAGSSLAVLDRGYRRAACSGPAITAFLRDRFNANENLVSLMLVYVAIHVVELLGLWPLERPGRATTSRKPKPSKSVTQMPRLMDGSRITIGLILGLGGGWIAVWVFLFRTLRWLCPNRWVGLAPARGALRRVFLAQGAVGGLLLLISGGAAGLAGALWKWPGPIGQLTPYVPAGYGFAAIIVAFVGRLHPAGMVLSAVLMSMFYIGGELAQSRLGLPKSITGVFQGLLLFCLLACDTLVAYRLRWVAAKKGGV